MEVWHSSIREKFVDGLAPFSRRAVEIFTRLRHPNLQSAQETLGEIEERMKDE